MSTTNFGSVTQHQAVDGPLTSSATFLVVSARPGNEAIQSIRSTLSSIDGLVKNVAIRHLGGSSHNLTCIVGVGSDFWNVLTRLPRPAQLRRFPILRGAVHSTVSTPGDLLFHIRSDRRDLCFEFERQLMSSGQLGEAVDVVDETVGFRYFDARDLLGFVDGTANPVGPEALTSAVVQQDDDANGVGGSYVVVQKYLHNLARWNILKVEQQETIIGRTKLDNVELDDADADAGQQCSHKTLTTIDDEHGVEHDILRDNMPFGSPASGEFGTYFIGYSRNLWVTEKMLERMFIGNGKHDQILDFSTPVTGGTFFAPSMEMLATLGDKNDK